LSVWDVHPRILTCGMMRTHVQSTTILDRQQALHTELLERELRLQQEIATRKAREEMETLKKQYAEDLSRNVQKEKTAILVRT
jgi:hypothetical protein